MVEAHRHSGFDSEKVRFSDLSNRKLWISHTISGTLAANPDHYGVIFINQVAPCYVSKFYEVHQVAGTNGSPVTIDLEKLTGTQAPGAGSSVLTAPVSLKATANTVQEGTITGVVATKNLNKGDRLCLNDGGTPTSVFQVTVFIELTFP